MMIFEFSYQGHSIKFENTLSGRERVWLDGALQSNKLNWRRNSQYEVTVAGDLLSLDVDTISAITGELRVRLRHGTKILDSKTLCVSLDTEKAVQFSENEQRWVNELEMSSSSTIIMYVLYFGIVWYSLLPELIDSEVIILLGQFAAGAALIWALGDFIHTCWKDLMNKEQDKVLPEV